MQQNLTPNVNRRPSPEPTSGWNPPWPSSSLLLHQLDWQDATPVGRLHHMDLPPNTPEQTAAEARRIGLQVHPYGVLLELALLLGILLLLHSAGKLESLAWWILELREVTHATPC